MTEKPNCGNCPHNVKSENRKGFKKCAITNYLLDKDFDLAKHMDVVLCLSHPGAREYLMRDTIKELDRRMKVCAKHGAFDKENIYEKAIALIRGEE